LPRLSTRNSGESARRKKMGSPNRPPTIQGHAPLRNRLHIPPTSSAGIPARMTPARMVKTNSGSIRIVIKMIASD
jgi:hypothetical protein